MTTRFLLVLTSLRQALASFDRLAKPILMSSKTRMPEKGSESSNDLTGETTSYYRYPIATAISQKKAESLATPDGKLCIKPRSFHCSAFVSFANCHSGSRIEIIRSKGTRPDNGESVLPSDSLAGKSNQVTECAAGLRPAVDESALNSISAESLFPCCKISFGRAKDTWLKWRLALQSGP